MPKHFALTASVLALTATAALAGPASAHSTGLRSYDCSALWDVKRTFYSTSCWVAEGPEPLKFFRAVAHCTNGTAYGEWAPTYNATNKRGSTARCAPGATWTSFDTEWRNQ
ncbi:hypothetical protein [Streptomyces spectabilis]|uniref:Secreted protein n=1 Tax=Streptomyces spectabilis TaxID=68270 RepID=A0A5P2X6K0_STRST|nr:hypothetical protein [Streptomyces spectabilis]UUW33149.1 hypothetical protein ctg4_97 [Streptomyces sp.]MBB5101277.1 hypothetical protein [Streptomyces spectabilis]MCI3900476.1 hypothetical protein [Streptomyces spectabilis]QEV58052.1 hypothetical protein CP982_04435 [Streptomyces spectabilis]GGV10350.1 hypothetical protein GCM10010245_19530 [Streptomyces spectabilis]